VKPINTSGKRKSALAKAVLKEGKGVIKINSRPINVYFHDMARDRVNELITLSEPTIKKVDVNVNVSGGGWQSQSEASRLAIARALAKYDKKLKKVFSDYDKHLLIADVRRKETRKPNTSNSARSKRQKSYR